MMPKPINYTLSTERLFLRSWQASDLEPFYQLNHCDHITRYLPKKLSREESDDLAKRLQDHIEQ